MPFDTVFWTPPNLWDSLSCNTNIPPLNGNILFYLFIYFSLWQKKISPWNFYACGFGLLVWITVPWLWRSLQYPELLIAASHGGFGAHGMCFTISLWLLCLTFLFRFVCKEGVCLVLVIWEVTFSALCNTAATEISLPREQSLDWSFSRLASDLHLHNWLPLLIKQIPCHMDVLESKGLYLVSDPTSWVCWMCVVMHAFVNIRNACIYLL